MPALYPAINGNRFSWSSIELRVAGTILSGFKAINYSHSAEPGLVYGAGSQIIGVTDGNYAAEGSLELYRAEWTQLLALLNASSPTLGFMRGTFDAFVHYEELAEGPFVVTDWLRQCRIKNVDHSNSQGSDATSVKLDLQIRYIVENGAAPYGPKQLV